MQLSLPDFREEMDELHTQWRGFSRLAKIFAAWRVVSWALSAVLPVAFLVTLSKGLWFEPSPTIPLVLLSLGAVLAATIATFDWAAERLGVDEELAE